jgi:dTMP kinase
LDQADVAFHERVRRGFQALVAANPDGWSVIDAAKEIDQVHDDVVAAVVGRFGERWQLPASALAGRPR